MVLVALLLVSGSSASFQSDVSLHQVHQSNDANDHLGVHINFSGREMNKVYWQARHRHWTEGARLEQQQQTQIQDLKEALKVRDNNIMRMRMEMTMLKQKMESMQQNHSKIVDSLIQKNQNVIQMVEQAVAYAKKL